jgi:hypothetical protein
MVGDKSLKEIGLDELKNYIDLKFKELEKTLQQIEVKGTKESLGANIQESIKKFEDLAISLSALVLGIASKLSESEKKSEYTKLITELGGKGKEAKLKLATELEALAKKLRE